MTLQEKINKIKDKQHGPDVDFLISNLEILLMITERISLYDWGISCSESYHNNRVYWIERLRLFFREKEIWKQPCRVWDDGENGPVCSKCREIIVKGQEYIMSLEGIYQHRFHYEKTEEEETLNQNRYHDI